MFDHVGQSPYFSSFELRKLLSVALYIYKIYTNVAIVVIIIISQHDQHLLTLSSNMLILIGSFSFQALIFFSPIPNPLFPSLNHYLSPQQSVLDYAGLSWYHLVILHSQLFLSSTQHIIDLTFSSPTFICDTMILPLSII